MVKNAARDFLVEGHDFSSDFNHNKTLLAQTNVMPGKKIRNKIAGYLARLEKAKSQEKAKAAKRAEKEAAKKAAELAKQEAEDDIQEA